MEQAENIVRRLEILEAALVRPERSYALARFLAALAIVCAIAVVSILIHIDMLGARTYALLAEAYEEGR